MYHFFVEPEQVGKATIAITGPDVNHIRNVLRMRAGEKLSVSDGRGKTYTGRIRALEPEQVLLEILETEETSVEPPCCITLYQGLPKGDKLEWIIQKCVELGVCRIVPVATRRTVVKLDAKKETARVQRWNSISQGAAKQAGRGRVPRVEKVFSFDQALEDAQKQDVFLLPYELARDMARTRAVLSGIQKGQRIGIFIGPEGGFDVEEAERAIEAGALPITLGPRILRTETAGMAVLSMLILLLEE